MVFLSFQQDEVDTSDPVRNDEPIPDVATVTTTTSESNSVQKKTANAPSLSAPPPLEQVSKGPEQNDSRTISNNSEGLSTETIAKDSKKQKVNETKTDKSAEKVKVSAPEESVPSKMPKLSKETIAEVTVASTNDSDAIPSIEASKENASADKEASPPRISPEVPKEISSTGEKDNSNNLALSPKSATESSPTNSDHENNNENIPVVNGHDEAKSTKKLSEVSNNFAAKVFQPSPPPPPPLEYWVKKNPVIDQVFITDVTSNQLTITVRECNTDSGFFKEREVKNSTNGGIELSALADSK